MKRTFQLQIEGKKPERVLDSIKHEVRKYLKRERRRLLPLGTDYWDFDCKFGVTEESSEVVHLSEIITRIDEISKANGTQLYVEIIAKAVKRKPRVITHGSEDEGEVIEGQTQPNESNTPQPNTQPVAQ